MAVVHIPDEYLKVLKEFIRLNNDRAVGVLGGALLDDTLTDAIISSWRNDDDKQTKTARDNFIREGGGALTFGLKIDLVYLSGLIGPGIHLELQTIKDIRNRFAHRTLLPNMCQIHSSVSFNSQEIVDRCNNLTFVLQVAPAGQFPLLPVETTNDRYVVSVLLYSAMFTQYSVGPQDAREEMKPLLQV
jgi:hypothetical protein